LRRLDGRIEVPEPEVAMSLERARELLTTVRAATQRQPIVQNLYIASFCLIYLMNNIWAARTLFFYITIPLALIGLNFNLVRSTLRHPIFLLATIYFLILIFTSLAAPDVRAKVIADHLLQSIRILLLFVVTADLIQRDNTFLRTFGLFLSVAAAISVMINMLAFYDGARLVNGSIFTTRLEGVPGANVYYNSNVVGVIYAMACVAGASLLASYRLSRWETGVVAISTFILFVATMLTQSRGSILAAIAGLGIIALLGANRRQLVWLGLSAAVVLAALLLWTPVVEVMAERGASLRPMVWSHYWNMAQERPWLGYGLSYDVTLRHHGALLLSAHNIILSAFVRGGVFAAIALLCLILTCLYMAWMAWRANRVVMPVALMVAGVVAAAVDHEMTATSLGWPWLLFWIPVALCLGASVRERPQPMPAAVRSGT
jgi:O-antigen ligase